MAAGFALTAGPWMALMVERYGNPLFPYYNDIFRSPWADPVSFSATRFGPTSLGEWLAFPFVMLWKVKDYVSEAEFRDARPALLYALALLAFFAVMLRRPDVPPCRTGETRSQWRFLGVFFLVSFVAWAVVYRIFRYLVPLELLGGAFIVYFIVRLVPARRVHAGARRGVRAGGSYRPVSDLVAAKVRGSLPGRDAAAGQGQRARAPGVDGADVVRPAVVSRGCALRRARQQLQRSRPPQPPAADDRDHDTQTTRARCTRSPFRRIATSAPMPWPRWGLRGNRARKCGPTSG